jgi:hypothetical protein
MRIIQPRRWKQNSDGLAGNGRRSQTNSRRKGEKNNGAGVLTAMNGIGLNIAKNGQRGCDKESTLTTEE